MFLSIYKCVSSVITFTLNSVRKNLKANAYRRRRGRERKHERWRILGLRTENIL